MFYLTVIIIFIISFLGMAFIYIRKISVLKGLEAQNISKRNFFSENLLKIKYIANEKKKQLLELDFWENWLHKIISKIKILCLKTETKCSHLLESTRSRTKRQKENKKYWDKMTKIIKKKSMPR